MEKILTAPMHIIVTVRGKDEYVMEEKNGKQTPKKVGVGATQEKDIEYNYTVTFNLQQDTNIAECQKDNTHLFENRYEKLTEQDGINIYNWANKGDDPVAVPAPAVKKPASTKTTPAPEISPTNNAELVNEITRLAKEILDKGEISKAELTGLIKEIVGVANFTNVTDTTKLTALRDALKERV